MASALAALGNKHRFHRFFDLAVFAAITAGYIVLAGSLASVLGSSNGTPGPETEQPQICQCSSKDEQQVPLEAAAADLQWTSVRQQQRKTAADFDFSRFDSLLHHRTRYAVSVTVWRKAHGDCTFAKLGRKQRI